MTSGIYRIHNLRTKRSYVGSAVVLANRRRQHLGLLRSGRHYNYKLQRGWDRYGEDAFTFDTLELVEDRATLIAREQHWINKLDACSRGYNLNPVAGSFFGRKHSPETRAKMSAIARTRPPIPLETRLKISAANTGTRHSEEWKAEHSARMTGRTPTAEHLAVQVAALRSPEVRAKISASSKGRVKTAEHIAKIAAAIATPEVQAKLKARKSPTEGTTRPDSTRALIRARAQARWADPVLRAKYVQARRERAHRESS